VPERRSDHFDGRRFFNPGAAADRRGLMQVLQWRMRGRPAPWAKPPPVPYPPPPASVPSGTAAVTFIGHSTFLIQLPRLTLLTDPVFSERCSPVRWAGPRRARPPGLALVDLPWVDLVLVSHNHYDHLDVDSLRRIAGRGTPIAVTSAGNAKLLRRTGFADVSELDWWESRTVGGWRITAIPARHFSRRGPSDGNRTLWAGFMLQSPDGNVLFAGDSGDGPHWADIRERLGAPDLALLPIGAYEPRWLMAPVHMDPAEAVRAHRTLGARRSVGMHFGTFRLTDEAIDAPAQALAAEGEPAFTTLGFGETRLVSLRSL
jgi:L-ascorbate metabolism protein UlaG (beta-lactamase superfamily)